jgi:multiple sugar transport system substrate-binding protein
MAGMGRRGFAAGTAAGLIGLSGRTARAEDLPRKYAGANLNILSRTSPPFDSSVPLGKEFTDATGIQLQFTRAAPSDHYGRMMLDLTSGTNAFDVSLFIYQWKQDIAPFMAELSTLNTDVPGAPPLALEDYPPKLLEIYGKVEAKLMGLPVLGDVAFMLWNQKAYAAKGIDPKAAPASWDEVVERGHRLTGSDQFGYALPAGKTPQCYVAWTLLFHAFGGTYFKPDGQPNLNSEAGVKAMRFMSDQLSSIAPPGNLTWDYAEVLNSFGAEKSTQAVMWPGGFPTLSDPDKSAVAGHYGMAPPPGGALLGGTSIGINAKSKHPEAARLYVAWTTSEAIVRRAALSGTAPARISVLSDPALVARNAHFPAVKEAMLGNTFGYIPMKESEQVLVMISDEANAACAKTKTAQQAADDLQAKTLQFMHRRGMLR